MEEKNYECKAKKSRGITLIVLVITIIILLLLSAVSITAVFGEGGLIELVTKSSTQTNEIINGQQQQISELENFLGNHLAGGGTGSGGTQTQTPTVPGKLKIADLMKKPEDEQISTENQDVEDEYGNPVTIPAGFKIVPNGTDGVVYEYDEGSLEHIPTVQDGIVIKDEENYFVWVPVCTVEKQGEEVVVTRGIKEKNGKTSGKVILGRYSFDGGSEDNYDYPEDFSGYESLEQYGINYNEKYSGRYFYNYYKETVNKEKDNEVARDLQKFVENTNEKGGYWFARYEAVKGTDGKVKSMASTEEQTKSNRPSDVTAGMVWSNIKQPEASLASKGMYTANSFETDLINSYAWDTAIVFIQTYSEENSHYSIKTSINKTIGNTGERVGTTDKVCNIYDMASNLYEWSTETYTDTLDPCVNRGGNYYYSRFYASYRYNGSTSDANGGLTFRPILYVTL